MNTHPNILLHKGFSLVQTLVAVSIMAGLSLGTMTMLDTAQKSSRRNEMRTVAGQLTNHAKDYLNAKETCGENITGAFTKAIVTDSVTELEGSIDALQRERLDENGNPALDEDGDVVPPFVIMRTGEDRSDGLRIEDIKVVWEEIADYEPSEEWDKMGTGRVIINMTYCEKGGIRCKEEQRKHVDRAIQLKEIYAKIDDGTGEFQEAICSSSQDGILLEAKRMVDEVQRQVCQLSFASAALSGDRQTNESCGTITEIEEITALEYLSAGEYDLEVPKTMSLTDCRFSGIVPGSVSVVLSGAGGGGHGSGHKTSGKGGYAGHLVEKSLSLPPGEKCKILIGKGGEPGSSNRGDRHGKQGSKGEASSIECGDPAIQVVKADGGAPGDRTDNENGGSGFHSALYQIVNGVIGGGGRGAEKGGHGSDPGELGGGGGGGAESTSTHGVRRASPGGDGGAIISWKTYTIEPVDGIHDCGVCEAGEVRNANGECVSMCSGSGKIYDEESDSCRCADHLIEQGGSCISCSESYAYGAEAYGDSCSCPTGQMRKYCNGTYMCMASGFECDGSSEKGEIKFE